jgi:enoyl-CoA hydratase/carnithine racemase
MANGNIVVTEDRATRVITLRRPSKKNAITQDMYRDMSHAIDTAQNNPDIRCMIITGGSGVFTAGDDIDDVLKADTSSPETLSNGAKFLYSLALNAKPIIAAVDGVSIGIGTTLLFHCDYVLASTAATFSAPYIHLGLVPVAASSLLMPSTMGYQRAFAMMVMGRAFTAEEAHAAGFVNAVVSPGHTESEAPRWPARSAGFRLRPSRSRASCCGRRRKNSPAASTRRDICSASASDRTKPWPRSTRLRRGISAERAVR